MDTIKLGGFEIARVLEDDQPIFSPWAMFPDATPAALESQRIWLIPRFYNEDRELLESTMHPDVFRTDDHTILIDTCVSNDQDRVIVGVPGAKANFPISKTSPRPAMRPRTSIWC